MDLDEILSLFLKKKLDSLIDKVIPCVASLAKNSINLAKRSQCHHVKRIEHCS